MKDSVVHQTLVAPFVQQSEGSNNGSKEQLEIENNKVSDLTGESLTIHIKKGV